MKTNKGNLLSKSGLGSENDKDSSPKESERESLGKLQSQILESLLYYEVFSFPLTSDEIFNNLRDPEPKRSAFDPVLQSMVNKGLLFLHNGYYSSKDIENWSLQRIEKTKRAARFIRISKRMGRFMAAFPYIKCVCVSGSLSKNWITEDGDIDYFLITKPGRLWIARTCLVVFKKLFLFNSHKYFCVNYFIDEENLEIEEKNRFTATEIVTLMPIAGNKLFREFIQANQWVKAYYPNYPARDLAEVPEIPVRSFGKLIQVLLNGRFGDWLDRTFLRFTLKRWQKKFNSLSPEQFEVAMKSRTYVSKHHPNHFQEKVMDAFQKNIGEFEQNHHLIVATLQEIE